MGAFGLRAEVSRGRMTWCKDPGVHGVLQSTAPAPHLHAASEAGTSCHAAGGSFLGRVPGWLGTTGGGGPGEGGPDEMGPRDG
ncbi:unnamed protein product [Gadus morhua 'NCC']